VKELWEIPVRAVEARSSLNTLYTHHLWPLTPLNIRFKLRECFSRNDLLLFHVAALACETDCEVFIYTGFARPGSTTKGCWGGGTVLGMDLFPLFNLERQTNRDTCLSCLITVGIRNKQLLPVKALAAILRAGWCSGRSRIPIPEIPISSLHRSGRTCVLLFSLSIWIQVVYVSCRYRVIILSHSCSVA
jgi:hypothetical protein